MDEEVEKLRRKAFLFLTNTTYVDVMWFIGQPGLDVLALVLRDADDAPWQFKIRFRIHNPDVFNPWAGKDQKRRAVYVGDCTDACRQMFVAGFDSSITLMQRLFPDEMTVDRVEVRGGFDATLAVLKSRPWAFMKEGQDARDYAKDKGWL